MGTRRYHFRSLSGSLIKSMQQMHSFYREEDAIEAEVFNYCYTLIGSELRILY